MKKAKKIDVLEQKETVYCSNCDNEATRFYTTSKGCPFFFCETCAEAFEIGQVNSETELEYLSELK